jgi:hypothetical protein
MKNKTRTFLLIALVLLLAVVITEPLAAQCAMCRATSESNLKAGGGDPRGLNAGIMYMFLLPYLIVGCIGIWWWRNRKSEPAVDEDQFREDELVALK